MRVEFRANVSLKANDSEEVRAKKIERAIEEALLEIKEYVRQSEFIKRFLFMEKV